MFRESQENLEPKEKYQGKFLDFFELSAEQTQTLKKKIEEHRGLVRIFVHPEYLEYAWGEEIDHNQEMVKKLKQMNEAMKRMLSSEDKKTPPIIIMEGQLGLLDKMKKWKLFDEKGITYADQVEVWLELRAQGKEKHQADLQKYPLANDTYIIPTAFANPMPLIDDMETEKDAWKKLNDQLLELGVTKILIAGNELHLPEVENDSTLGGCLAITIEELKNNFEIELSTLTYPTGRRELREKNIKI